MIHAIQTGPFGVNTYIVELKGSDVFIVDPACCRFCHDETVVANFMAAHGFVPKAILLTHGHFDHVSGIKSIKENFPHVPVLIHEKDREYIGKDSQKIQKLSLLPMGFDEFLPTVSDLPEPDFLIEDEKLLSDYVDCPAMEEWKILHTPGHTQGCCCFYNKKNRIIITGDTVFYHSWGRTDLYGGNENQIMESLRRIKKEIPGETKVYPGHDYFGFTLNQN